MTNIHRESCGACGGSDLHVFLDLGKTPLANKYPAARDTDEQWYPLQLGRCGNCGLVQLMCVVPDREIYNDEYGFYSGASQTQRTYHMHGAELLMGKYRMQAEHGVIEVACNDGSMLRHFKEAGIRTLGIDPASGPVALAREAGLDVLEASLTLQLAQRIREDHGPFGLVIAYNSMAHIENLSDVMAGIRALMNNDSLAVFEMQYFPDLITGNMYDQVYHEHRFYYTLTSLQHVARLHGLYVIEAELIELQGGGMRVTLTPHATAPTTTWVQRILDSERWLSEPCVYDGFQGQVERTRKHLQDIILAEKRANRRIGGYAAAAKACTIMNFCDLRDDLIEYVIDTTPYKQGRYVPGTNVEIISPEDAAEDPVDTMLLLSSNYLGPMIRNNPEMTRWVTPLPMPAVI